MVSTGVLISNFFMSLYQSFGDCTQLKDYNCYHHHFHIRLFFQYFSKVWVLISFFILFQFLILSMISNSSSFFQSFSRSFLGHHRIFIPPLPSFKNWNLKRSKTHKFWFNLFHQKELVINTGKTIKMIYLRKN